MVAGMGRCKAGADGAITHQDMDSVGKFGAMAGPEAENEVFYPTAADLVAQGGCYYE